MSRHLAAFHELRNWIGFRVDLSFVVFLFLFFSFFRPRCLSPCSLTYGFCIGGFWAQERFRVGDLCFGAKEELLDKEVEVDEGLSRIKFSLSQCCKSKEVWRNKSLWAIPPHSSLFLSLLLAQLISFVKFEFAPVLVDTAGWLAFIVEVDIVMRSTAKAFVLGTKIFNPFDMLRDDDTVRLDCFWVWCVRVCLCVDCAADSTAKLSRTNVVKKSRFFLFKQTGDTASRWNRRKEWEKGRERVKRNDFYFLQP